MLIFFSDNPLFIADSEPESETEDDDDIIEEPVDSDSQSLISAYYDESILSDYSEQAEEEEDAENTENEVISQGLCKL